MPIAQTTKIPQTQKVEATRKETVKIQVFITPEAALRLRVAAAAQDVPQGTVVADLCEEYLPAIPKDHRRAS